MWMMPLHLHVNQKSDHDYDDDERHDYQNFIKNCKNKIIYQLPLILTALLHVA